MNSAPIEPDTKDWTWVLERPCLECGFEAALVDRTGLPELLRDNATGWTRKLTEPRVAQRPEPAVWSALEYACHVRDVHRLFDQRVRLMLEEDQPEFADWDQDLTALEDDYARQVPGAVAGELADAADAVGRRYAEVSDDAWSRRGLRSNGSEFTVDSIARYHLHDVVHHAHDVGLAGPA